MPGFWETVKTNSGVADPNAQIAPTPRNAARNERIKFVPFHDVKVGDLLACRPRLYPTNAARQKAYRVRHMEKHGKGAP